MEDSIVRETVVAATTERVWQVLTRPEYLPRWFGAEKAEVDLRPGGALVMVWAEHGTGYARIERVDEPTLFSFRWAIEPGAQPTPGEETLVEFTLAPEGDGTRLRVVESGFSTLDRPAEKQEWHRERNVDGWRQVLEAVAAHFTGVTA
ncbi:MAG TPA: SRPBCC domain-containing protein [Pseudonocardia sp.]